MATIKLSNGAASGVITGDMAAFVQSLLDSTQNTAVKALREKAEDVAKTARASWYSKVTEETGKSGDIISTVTVNPTTGDVRVGVGTTDTRTSKGRPTPVFIHAPFPGALVKTEVTKEEYLKEPVPARAWVDYKANRFYVWRKPTVPASGEYLLETQVKSPFRKAIKNTGRMIAREAIKNRKMAAKASKKGGG